MVNLRINFSAGSDIMKMMKATSQLNTSVSARSKERGSALFYILIAVVLFAALSYTVSNMMRGDSSAEMVGEERAKVLASEILNYGRAVRTAVQDMRISNGCADTDISFENNEVSGYTNTSCQVFNPAGGDVTYIAPIADILDSEFEGEFSYGNLYFNGSNEIVGVGTTCGDISCMDLVMFIPYVKEEVCRAINESLGVTSAGDAVPSEGVIAFWPGEEFDGVYGASTIDRVIGDDAPVLANQPVGCLFLDEAGHPYETNFFYQVLIAR